MVEPHWRPDPRCAQVRIDAHSLSYQAINEVPFMSTAERNLVIRATGSYPEDAMSFCEFSSPQVTYTGLEHG